MKRDLRKAEEEKWREKANDRDQWKQITKVAVLRSDRYTSLTPTQGNQRKNNISVFSIANTGFDINKYNSRLPAEIPKVC